MKICYLGNIHSLHLNVFIDHFSKQGDEVHIFGEQAPAVERQNVVFHDLFPFHTKTVRTGGVVKATPKKQKKPLARMSRSLLDIYTFFRIRSLVKRIRPDIIHGHEANDWGLSTALLGGCPRILTCWGSDVFRVPGSSGVARARINFALRHVELIHVTYPYTKQYLIENFKLDPGRIEVRTWGLDLAMFDRSSLDPERIEGWRRRLGLAPGEKVLLYAKGFREDARQNYLNLIRAFLNVSRDYPDLRLVLLSYGMTDRLDAIKDLVLASGTEDRVTIVEGMLPQAEMPYALSVADAFAVLEDTDQFSGVILEGMMMGSVPLLSDIPQYRLTLRDGENCLFVDQKSLESIQTSIRRLMDDLDGHKERMRIPNRVYAQGSERKSAMKSIAQMYSKLARRSDKSTR